MAGTSVGVGIIFGNYLAATLCDPSATRGQFGNLIFALLYMLMSRVALLRIGAIMAERSKQIAEHVAAAQAALF